MPSVSTPLVTIGLPFYNAATTLRAAIASVLCQTFTDWELILVNDGSTDESMAACHEALRDKRVTIIDDPTNRGLPHRLNQIADRARGEILARMDADDLMHPDRIRRQVDVLSRRPDADMVNVATYIMSADGRIVGLSPVRRPVNARQRLMFSRVNHGAITARTEWFRAHRYDERFLRSQDLELWIRAADDVVIAELDEPLYFSRQDASLIPAAKYRRSHDAHIDIVRLHGPQSVGRLQMELLVLTIRAKGLFYQALRSIGRPEIVNRIRVRGLSVAGREEGEQALEMITLAAADFGGR